MYVEGIDITVKKRPWRSSSITIRRLGVVTFIMFEGGGRWVSLS